MSINAQEALVSQNQDINWTAPEMFQMTMEGKKESMFQSLNSLSIKIL